MRHHLFLGLSLLGTLVLSTACEEEDLRGDWGLPSTATLSPTGVSLGTPTGPGENPASSEEPASSEAPFDDLVLEVPPGWPLDEAYDCGPGEFSHPGSDAPVCHPLAHPDYGYEGFEPTETLEVGEAYPCSAEGLQDALDDAASGWTEVRISESCDRIDVTERIDLHGQTILDGNGALLVLDGVVGNGLMAADTGDVVVRNLEVDASGQRAGGPGEANALSFWQTGNILVERVEVYGGVGSGLFVGGPPSTDVTIRYSVFTDFGRHGIGVGINSDAHHYTVYSNFLDGNAQIPSKGGLNLDTLGRDSEIAGNWVSNSGIRGAKFPGLSSSLIHSNAFVDNAMQGLFAHSTSEDLTIARNLFAGNGSFGTYVSMSTDQAYPVRLHLEDNVYANGAHANGWNDGGDSIGIGHSAVTLCGADVTEYQEGRVREWGGASVTPCD